MKTPLKLLAFLLLACFTLTTTANAAAHAPHHTATAPAPVTVLPAPVVPQVADSSYVILAGDVLQVTVWKEDGLDRETLVLPDGSINFPLIGSIRAEGKSAAELQDIVKKKLKKLIPDASVTVSVKAALGHSVNVIGQVQKPGEFVINHRLTAMQALSQAGGLTPFASESSIIVLRHEGEKEISISIPYSDIAEGDDLDKDIDLQPGDVIVVPTASLF